MQMLTKELQSALEELTKVREYKETLETIIDNDSDCFVVVNADGIITMFNKAYEDFIGVSKEQAIGRHVTEVIENTRLHIVAKTGVAEMAALQKICGREMICNRVPIKEDGKLIGAIGKVMFKDFNDFSAFVDKFSKMQAELEYYRDIVKKIQVSHYTFDQVIGSGPEISEVKEMAQRAAQRSSTVLIRGESGTGKELFAHAIHFASTRKNGPFIKVNCCAIPESLLESELFGYEEGAFTGAKKGGKPGKFELAHKGTLFLDEIGDMPVNMQSKLLRVLQEKEFERVGGTAPIPVDVRVIAATNRNLEDLIKEERFRQDLYYRLNVVELRIPPLRYHKKDMDELTSYVLAKLAAKLGCPIPVIDEEARQAILSYNWPGNVRELENVLERCLNFIDHGVIRLSNLPYNLKNAVQGKENQVMELRDHMEEAERLTIVNALKSCNGNKVRAAKLLGISRANIYQKITKYNIG
jgi:PAS domain S-box-containing protein